MPLARAWKHWSVPLAPGRVPLQGLDVEARVRAQASKHWAWGGGEALYYGRGSCLACGA